MNIEDALYQFAVEEKHDRETLETYLKLYPHLAEDLIDLCSEIRLEEAMEANPIAFDDPGLDAAWEEFKAAGQR